MDNRDTNAADHEATAEKRHQPTVAGPRRSKTTWSEAGGDSRSFLTFF